MKFATYITVFFVWAAATIAPSFAAGAAPYPVLRSKAATSTAIAPSAKVRGSAEFHATMAALKTGKANQAIALSQRLSIPSERHLTQWMIARSGDRDVPSAFIQQIMRQLPSWPHQNLMRTRWEEAFNREASSPQAIVSAYQAKPPRSLTGQRALAAAYLQLGDKKRAHNVVARMWRHKKLSSALEKSILRKFSAVLTRNDHFHRASMLLYYERAKGAEKLLRYLSKDQKALVKARIAVIRKSKHARAKLNAVPRRMRKDPGYQFSLAQYLRRNDKHVDAAKILIKATQDPQKAINAKEWWTERRVLSRALLDRKKTKLAYQVTTNRATAGPAQEVEAEFHAGWYALRFLNSPVKAEKHFRRINVIGKKPRTEARGHYWTGRALEAQGRKKQAQQAYMAGSIFGETYYGQLSRAALGQKSTGIASLPHLSHADRSRFLQNEQVQAIYLLRAVKQYGRSRTFFWHLAKTHKQSNDLVLLAHLAEQLGDHRSALIVGKIAADRDRQLVLLAFPTKAMPKNTKWPSSLERAVVYSIARQESAFDPQAVSHAGARGLLQLMPGTAKLTARSVGLAYSKSKLTSHPGYNATLGAAHLAKLIGRYDGSYVKTFAGYNAGAGRVTQWVKKYGDPSTARTNAIDWVERIPFTETRNYVQKILENLQVYKSRLGRGKMTIIQDLKRG